MQLWHPEGGWRGHIPNWGYIRKVDSGEEGKGGDVGLIWVIYQMGEWFHNEKVKIVRGKEDIGCLLGQMMLS